MFLTAQHNRRHSSQLCKLYWYFNEIVCSHHYSPHMEWMDNDPSHVTVLLLQVRIKYKRKTLQYFTISQKHDCQSTTMISRSLICFCFYCCFRFCHSLNLAHHRLESIAVAAQTEMNLWMPPKITKWRFPFEWMTFIECIQIDWIVVLSAIFLRNPKMKTSPIDICRKCGQTNMTERQLATISNSLWWRERQSAYHKYFGVIFIK